MEKPERDLEADLRLCNEATPGPHRVSDSHGLCVVRNDPIGDVVCDLIDSVQQSLVEEILAKETTEARLAEKDAENARLRAVLEPFVMAIDDIERVGKPFSEFMPYIAVAWCRAARDELRQRSDRCGKCHGIVGRCDCCMD